MLHDAGEILQEVRLLFSSVGRGWAAGVGVNDVLARAPQPLDNCSLEEVQFTIAALGVMDCKEVQTMRCPTCGINVSEGTTFCPDCGTEITNDQAAGSEQAPQVANLQQDAQPVAVGGVSAPPVMSPPSPVAAPPTGIARLLLKRGGILTGEEFVIGSGVVIGRFHEETGPVDVDLSHLPERDYVSRRHAEIGQDASGQWFVNDLDSTNGTYLWSPETRQFQRLPSNQSIPIKDGDEIVFGNVRFVFRVQG